jgi:hypothetical protein
VCPHAHHPRLRSATRTILCCFVLIAIICHFAYIDTEIEVSVPSLSGPSYICIVNLRVDIDEDHLYVLDHARTWRVRSILKGLENWAWFVYLAVIVTVAAVHLGWLRIAPSPMVATQVHQEHQVAE